MNNRIRHLVEVALNEEIYPENVEIELDPFDDKLAEPIRNAKRLTDFILAQKIVLTDENNLIGLMKFNKAPVPADIFKRSGHRYFSEVCGRYYGKPQENLCTFEWQHSNPNLAKVVQIGLRGYIDEINEARAKYLGETDHLVFLTALEMIIQGLEKRVDQYRAFCVEKSEKAANPERKKMLRHMARTLEQVPMKPARTFEEAIQCIYICWMCLPDSIGRADQYLYPRYKHDTESGILTREHAIELIQEFFIAIHQNTPHTSGNDGKGAESHFVVGGYTIDHEDAFNELSELIMEAMMDMPLIRPQVSLRWNAKTPFAVLKKMLDYERNDKNKRIAFVNDEPRIKAMMEIQKLPWEAAYDYIMVGCNEPAFQGGISLKGNKINIVRSLINTFNNRRTETLETKTFDEFYALYEQELAKDIETMLNYSNRFNILRARDCNVMSSIFLEGCIERAESATRGGASLAQSGLTFIGGTNLIDSLSIIKQFVFDEQRVSMNELLTTLDNDWKDAEELRQTILRDGKFFGNNEEHSNKMAQRFHKSLYDLTIGRRDIFGNRLACGNLTGYNPHHAWFGALMGATPDGRVAGSSLVFGSGQVCGKDRDGASSHLLSVAQMDPAGIMYGDTIMNLTMEEETIRNEESFDKFAHLVEAYFKAGGLHIQLNYVSREELIAAKKDPQDYKSLRVRVTGFSGIFVNLNPDLQDNVINRTSGKI